MNLLPSRAIESRDIESFWDALWFGVLRPFLFLIIAKSASKHFTSNGLEENREAQTIVKTQKQLGAEPHGKTQGDQTTLDETVQ